MKFDELYNSLMKESIPDTSIGGMGGPGSSAGKKIVGQSRDERVNPNWIKTYRKKKHHARNYGKKSADTAYPGIRTDDEPTFQQKLGRLKLPGKPTTDADRAAFKSFTDREKSKQTPNPFKEDAVSDASLGSKAPKWLKNLLNKRLKKITPVVKTIKRKGSPVDQIIKNPVTDVPGKPSGLPPRKR